MPSLAEEDSIGLDAPVLVEEFNKAVGDLSSQKAAGQDGYNGA